MVIERKVTQDYKMYNMNLQEETREEVEKLQTEHTESETVEKTEDAEVVSEPVEEQPTEEAKVDEVPASFQKRIDELTWKYKSEREQRQKLEEEFKSKRDNPSKPTTEEEQREQDARDYLSKLVDERLGSIKSQEEQEDKKLQDEVDHVQALYPDFKKMEVLKVMDKYGINDVERAYTAWKEMSRVVAETKEQTKKDIISKPKSPSSVKTVDGFNNKFDEKTLSEKSIWELAEMAKKEAGY